ncbi:MAG: hypothetical protein PHT07_23545 [Paludibacter sp.]|nr:hypothetical protein [Paludibacter sp.]
MKNRTLKLYDRLLVAILFSFFLVTSCKPDEPVPAYGVTPMYGVVPATTVTIHKIPQTNHIP